MSKFLIIIILGAISYQSQATIPIQVELVDEGGGQRTALVKANLREDITAGRWDLYQIRYPIVTEGKISDSYKEAIHIEKEKAFVEVRSETFPRLPTNIQDTIIDNLASYNYRLKNHPTYRAAVQEENLSLLDGPILDWLKIDNRQPTSMPAHHLLSSFAKRWAYRVSDDWGPNCWHSSMASIFSGWKRARFMSAEEFTCHIKTSFREIDELSQWGDLISITSSKGGEVHGFTYVGVNEKDHDETIVFTKNGSAKGYYLFMTLESVKKIYARHGAKTVQFFRATEDARDPSEVKTAPCRAEYEKTMEEYKWSSGIIGRNEGSGIVGTSQLVRCKSGDCQNAIPWRPDPVILEGLKRKPPSEFEPIRLDTLSSDHDSDSSK